MAFWKDKEGKELTFKEFWTRWKEGVKNMTPLQQAKSTQFGFWIILVGCVWGLIYGVIAKMWWLDIVLLGTLIINSMGALSNLQKVKILEQVEEAMKASVVAGQVNRDYIN